MKQLREYQSASIDALRNGFAAGHTRQVLCAATGAGKTVISTHMLRLALDKGSRVMFVCDRRILVEQCSRQLWAENIPHGIIMQGHPQLNEPCQVASIQTLERCDGWFDADLIIVDEIHAVMRKSLIAYMKNRSKTKIIGLTATPFNQALAESFSNVVNVVTMEQLVGDGFLVPFRVFAATEINTAGVKVVAGEWQKDELEQRSLQVIGDVVADYVKINNDVFNGIPQKTIVFSSGVGHGAELVNAFAGIGLNFVQVSYLDSDEYKRDVFAEFAKPDTSINGIISTDILTRGFDQPDVMHVVVAKPLRKSFSQHVQMIGRGSRPYTGKEFCVIQDNSGNWMRFAESYEKLYENGVKSLASDEDKKTRKEKTDKEKKEARCPQCKQIWVGRIVVCPTCGYERKQKSLAETVAGEISEITMKNRKDTQEYKTGFYRQLLQYAYGKGYAEGWAYHKYKERFGVYPNGIKKEREPVNYETYKWIQSRAIRYSKRRA